MKPNPEIAVIILSFNGLSDLQSCLPSVMAAKQTNHRRQIIVVDNNSSDESLAYINNFSEIKLMAQNRNLGFAAGNNVALNWALEQGYDYAVLLNQDTVVEPDWLDNLTAAGQEHPRAGAIQALLTLWPQTGLVNSWGNQLHFLGFGYAGGHGRPISELSDSLIHQVAYPSGAAVLLRVATLKQVGLLDETLNTYHEDLELGWRLWLAQWQVLIQPAAIVHHRYEFKRSITKFYFMERNRWLVLLTHWRIGTLTVLLPALLIMEIGQLLFSLFNGYAVQRLTVYRYLCSHKNWRWILSRRKELKKIRQVPDRNILQRCTGSIKFQELRPWPLLIANPLMELYLRVARLVVRW